MPGPTIPPAPPSDALWYKDAVIMEVHVRAFCDSNGDGIGDFPGLVQKLDYLQDLGVTAVWLLPFYPSPLKDDGYDTSDYTGVHPAYGTIDDFRAFLEAAHRRGLKVITELVLNHTSDQHPWFQRARRAPPGSVERDFYVWSDTADRYKDARIIFTDFELSNWTWDPQAQAYYWHRFYHHQPDLNFDNPAVHTALIEVMDFWFSLGVDGMRLDAVPYLYEREGTNCENLVETHQFLKKLRSHLDQAFSGKMLLAEANQWPEDSVAYFGEGDECHMAFHFPIMPRLFMSLKMEDRHPILDILEQTPQIPETCQWAMFLRNHDELTLEMVTDEERDYMYRVYAHDPQMRINMGIRRRLAPLLGNDRRQIELMNGLLFALPGTPVLYYGDELGMGDNIYLGDRNGVRTPMQWSPDRNAGFSRSNPQRLFFPVVVDPEYHYEALNVEALQQNPNSLLWWMKRLIGLRRRSIALGRGTLKMITPDNRHVLAFVREREGARVLVVANLSRFIQAVSLDLSAYKDLLPIEMFGGTPLPRIEERPYLLTLGPYAFYWFELTPPEPLSVAAQTEPPSIEVRGPWTSLVLGENVPKLLGAVMRSIRADRIHLDRVEPVKSLAISGTVELPTPEGSNWLALVTAEHVDADPSTFILALSYAEGEEADRLLRERPTEVHARLLLDGGRHGVLVDALAKPGVAARLYDVARQRERLVGQNLRLCGHALGTFPEGPPEPSQLVSGEHRNVLIAYQDRAVAKIYRRLEAGTHPESEIGLALGRIGFPHSARVFGGWTLEKSDGRSATLGVLSAFVGHSASGWTWTSDALRLYFDRVVTQQLPAVPRFSPWEDLEARPSDEQAALIGDYAEAAERIGERTADLHLALASIDDPGFRPEPFSTLYQRSIYQAARSAAAHTIDKLTQHLSRLGPGTLTLAQRVLAARSGIEQRFRAVMQRKIAVTRTRYHGDYHLGQLLFTGKDFAVIDFEGEPSLSLSARRIKRSPLRDVAGILRSFHYASARAFYDPRSQSGLRPEDLTLLAPWSEVWRHWVSVSFLRGYFARARDASFVPRSLEERRILLEMYVLERAVHEVAHELDRRPDWVDIPLQGILQIVDTTG